MGDFRMAKARLRPDPWASDETDALLAEIQALYRTWKSAPSDQQPSIEAKIRVLADRFWKMTA